MYVGVEGYVYIASYRCLLYKSDLVPTWVLHKGVRVLYIAMHMQYLPYKTVLTKCSQSFVDSYSYVCNKRMR